MEVISGRRYRTRPAYLCLGLVALVAVIACRATTASSPSAANPAERDAVGSEGVVIEVPGRTQCILSRKFTIAPTPMHPVTDVLVEPGSAVKKGQVLVKLDDDEPQADVRGKQAILESTEIALKEARRYQEQSEKTYHTGALPEQRYHEVRASAMKAEKEERAAKAALDSAKAELEHYEITAPFDGVVSWLDVNPGVVSRPILMIWGEVMDLRELDVRCDLTLEQAELIKVGQAAEIRKNGKPEVFGVGHVVYVGIAADKKENLVPVSVRLTNSGNRLRCNEPVMVRFLEEAVSGGK